MKHIALCRWADLSILTKTPWQSLGHIFQMYMEPEKGPDRFLQAVLKVPEEVLGAKKQKYLK